MDFEEAVLESTIPFLVEARDWARLPERFHLEIEREYVVVAGSAPGVSTDHAEQAAEQRGDRGARKREP